MDTGNFYLNYSRRLNLLNHLLSHTHPQLVLPRSCTSSTHLGTLKSKNLFLSKFREEISTLDKIWKAKSTWYTVSTYTHTHFKFGEESEWSNLNTWPIRTKDMQLCCCHKMIERWWGGDVSHPTKKPTHTSTVHHLDQLSPLSHMPFQPWWSRPELVEKSNSQASGGHIYASTSINLDQLYLSWWLVLEIQPCCIPPFCLITMATMSAECSEHSLHGRPVLVSDQSY
jgi:hypothetical protein